jgi:CBS domain-containing protein
MKTAQDFKIEIPVLKYNDQITRARQILRDDRFREIYVVDAKSRLLGYLDITDGLRVTATKSNVTVEGFVKDAARVGPQDTIESVAKTMREFHTDSAAVVDTSGHVTGAVLLTDLFPVIVTRNELHGIVSDHMTKKVASADPADPLQKICTMITESGYVAFPVIKKKKLVGIISRRDLINVRRKRTGTTRNTHTTVDEVMIRECITIAPGEPLSAAADLLVKRDISLLPVVEDGTLVGIINRHDLVAAL